MGLGKYAYSNCYLVLEAKVQALVLCIVADADHLIGAQYDGGTTLECDAGHRSIALSLVLSYRQLSF